MNLAFGWKMLIVVDMCLALYLYFTYIVNVTIRNDSEDNVCIAVSQYRTAEKSTCLGSRTLKNSAGFPE